MFRLRSTRGIAPVLAAAFFLLPGAASAHGDGMVFTATTTAEGGETRLIDVDYSDSAVYAGTPGRFDFKLFSDAERTQAVPFTDLWVRIEEKKENGRGTVLFAGAIAKMEFGGTGFSNVFPNGGEYVLSVRYNDATKDAWGTTVAEAEFPLTVAPDPNAPRFYLLPSFWMGVVAGLFVTLAGAAVVSARSRFS